MVERSCRLLSSDQFLRGYPFTVFQTTRSSHDHFYFTIPRAVKGQQLKGKNHPFEIIGGVTTGTKDNDFVRAVAITAEDWTLCVHGLCLSRTVSRQICQ
jgi:hypothetical protein